MLKSIQHAAMAFILCATPFASSGPTSQAQTTTEPSEKQSDKAALDRSSFNQTHNPMMKLPEDKALVLKIERTYLENKAGYAYHIWYMRPHEGTPHQSFMYGMNDDLSATDGFTGVSSFAVLDLKKLPNVTTRKEKRFFKGAVYDCVIYTSIASSSWTPASGKEEYRESRHTQIVVLDTDQTLIPARLANGMNNWAVGKSWLPANTLSISVLDQIYYQGYRPYAVFYKQEYIGEIPGTFQGQNITMIKDNFTNNTMHVNRVDGEEFTETVRDKNRQLEIAQSTVGHILYSPQIPYMPLEIVSITNANNDKDTYVVTQTLEKLATVTREQRSKLMKEAKVKSRN